MVAIAVGRYRSDQLEKLDSVVIVVVVGRPPLGVAEKRHMSRKITKLEAGIWPELIGRQWYEAERIIRKQFPNITIQVLPEGTYVKKEFSPDRVKIVIDGEGRVLFAPAIG